MKNQQMILPSKCETLDGDVMELINGGGVQLSYTKGYLSKSVCIADAKMLVQSGAVKNMTISDVAAEIYAHAKIYYSLQPIISLGATLGVDFCESLADGIDIEDHKDNRTFMGHYYYEYFNDIYNNL